MLERVPSEYTAIRAEAIGEAVKAIWQELLVNGLVTEARLDELRRRAEQRMLAAARGRPQLKTNERYRAAIEHDVALHVAEAFSGDPAEHVSPPRPR